MIDIVGERTTLACLVANEMGENGYAFARIFANAEHIVFTHLHIHLFARHFIQFTHVLRDVHHCIFKVGERAG